MLFTCPKKYICSWSQAFGPSGHHSRIENHTQGSILTVGCVPIGSPIHSPGPQKAFAARGTRHLVSRPLGLHIVSDLCWNCHHSGPTHIRFTELYPEAQHLRSAYRAASRTLGPSPCRGHLRYVYPPGFPPVPPKLMEF